MITAGKTFGDWNDDCSFSTLVDSALAGSQACASFFSAPVSFPDSDPATAATISQNTRTAHLLRRPAGSRSRALAFLISVSQIIRFTSQGRPAPWHLTRTKTSYISIDRDCTSNYLKCRRRATVASRIRSVTDLVIAPLDKGQEALAARTWPDDRRGCGTPAAATCELLPRSCQRHANDCSRFHLPVDRQSPERGFCLLSVPRGTAFLQEDSMRLTLSRHRGGLAGLAAVLAAVLAAGLALASAPASARSVMHGDGQGGQIRHVLLMSVDGLHQQDLTWYVRTHPNSVLAALTRRGLEYSSAMTPFPSDSFPGMVGQVTGGDPGVTGIYYDDTFNHSVFPA